MIFQWIANLWKFLKPSAKPKPPLEAWNDDLHEWLRVLQAVFNDFPDHSRFENVQLDEKTAKILHEISTLYLEDACNAVSGFAVKAERLQRHLNSMKSERHLSPSSTTDSRS
jgi:hypothetical protein